MVLLKSFISCLVAASLILGAPTRHQDPKLVHSAASSESYSITNSSCVLQKELDSIMLLNHLDINSVGEEDHQNNVLVIPRHHINEKVMNRLGFKNVIKHAKKFKLSNPSFDSPLEVMIPEKTMPLFLFNTSDALHIPSQKTRTEYANFLDHAIPFELPQFTSLIDYYLVLPVPADFDKKALNNDDIILTSKFNLSIFRHPLKDDNPLLVFMFRSGNSVFEAKEHNIPLLKIKNYMGNQDLNLFFDIFAKEWITSVSYSQFIHSTFCTVNVDTAHQSYCVKVKEDMNNLALFPAYSGLKKLNSENLHQKRNTQDSDYQKKKIDYDFESLMKRDTAFSSKGGSAKSSEDPNFPELTLPLSIIKDNDEGSSTSVDTYSPRAKGYAQVVTKLKTLKHKSLEARDAAKSGSQDYEDLAKLEEVQSELEHRLKLKNNRKKVKSDSNTFVVSKASKDDERQPTRSGKRVKKVLKTKNQSPLDDEVSRRNSKQTKDTIPEVKSHSTTAATKDELKNVSTDEKDCVPITWVNVFHQSIFGKQKFCGV